MRKEGDIKYILLCLFEDMSETSTLVSDSKESQFKSEKVSLTVFSFNCFDLLLHDPINNLWKLSNSNDSLWIKSAF